MRAGTGRARRERGGGGYARAARGSGYVEFVCADADGAAQIAAAGSRDLVFARQLLQVLGSARELPPRDRLGVLLPIIESDARRWCDAWGGIAGQRCRARTWPPCAAA